MTTETVLIIDDSAEIRSLLESLLPFAGYETLSAGTGWEGLGLVFHARPDVLLLDLELPDIGGLKILEQLNRANLSIPSVIMTGYGSEGVAAKALRLGALGYLIKPFTAEEVLATVEKALTMGRLVRERASLSALVDRQTRYLQALSTLSQALVNSTDCDLLFQRIVDAAQFMTRADSSWLSLRRDEGPGFRVIAQRGKAGCANLEFCETSGSESVAPVLTQGIPLRARAASGTTIRLQTEDQVKALLQMPLGLPEASVGLLSVDRRESDVPFSEQDQELLQILASYVLLALERNRRPGQGTESTH